MFHLPESRWKLHLLIVANAISGCIFGILLMIHLQHKFQVKANDNHQVLMQLCSDPKIRTRIELMAVTGKPFDDKDEMVIKGICNMSLVQIEEYKMGVFHE